MTKDKHPPAALFFGDDAFDEFNQYLSRLIHEGATGQTFILVREDGFTLTPKAIEAEDLVMGMPEACEFVILDGGALDGSDAWKVTYQPEQRVCTVISEK